MNHGDHEGPGEGCQLCDADAPSAATYARRYRDKRRGGPPRVPAPCGTRAAAARHRRHGEPLDPACAEAERAYIRYYKRAGRYPSVTDEP